MEDGGDGLDVAGAVVVSTGVTLVVLGRLKDGPTAPTAVALSVDPGAVRIVGRS